MSAPSFALACVALLAACVPPPTRVPPDDESEDAGTDAQDAGTDAGSPDDGGAADAGSSGTGAIDAPAKAWTYVPFDDAKCANGTSTGLAVNLAPGSSTLVMFLAGGGACWEVGACYVLKTAVHVEDTVQEAITLAEAKAPGLDVLFSRTDAENPLRDASFAYVPYCTADLHSGTRVQRYELLGQVRDLHHVGALNLDAYLQRLVPTAKGVKRVVLAGASAGGYGALMQWKRVQQAFGEDVRVDLLDDSGLPVPMAWDRFGTAMAAWGTAWPEGCETCATDGFANLLPFYAEDMPATNRLALFAWRKDSTIATYWGVSGTDVQNGLDVLKLGAPASQKFFLLDGESHVVLATPDRATAGGKTARAWLHEFETDTAGWTHAGP